MNMSLYGMFSICPCSVDKIPLNPPLPKGEAGLIYDLLRNYSLCLVRVLASILCLSAVRCWPEGQPTV